MRPTASASARASRREVPHERLDPDHPRVVRRHPDDGQIQALRREQANKLRLCK